MKFVLLMLSILTLMQAGEFSTNSASYAPEFFQVTQQESSVNPTTNKKKSVKKIEKKKPIKAKSTGYERARKTYGRKVVEVSTLDDAKKMAKSRKDLVVFDKSKGTIVSSSLSALFNKSKLVIMLKVNKRGDGEILYNIYFFKKG